MEHCNSPVTEKENRPGDKRSVQDHTASLSSSHDLIQNLKFFHTTWKETSLFSTWIAEFFAFKAF